MIEIITSFDDLIKKLNNLTENASNIMLIRGKRSFVQSKAAEVISIVLKKRSFFEYFEFENNPRQEDVQKGLSLLKKYKADVILSIGGGSAIDMAKLIRFYAKKNVPLIAIPTTAGTGAEATQFAVCYIDGVKHSISDPSILPDKVILYPPFTYGNSPYLTTCTGFDALAQAIEAYWNVNATAESDEYAVEAIRLIYNTLKKESLSEQDRADLLLGANYAGRAINITRTTVPHALSYTLTSKYGYPHGHAVALTFPYFLHYNLNGREEEYLGKNYQRYTVKMNSLCEMLQISRENSFTMMKDYLRTLGLIYDVNRDFDNAVVAAGINMQRAKNTPIRINEKIIGEAVQSIRE